MINPLHLQTFMNLCETRHFTRTAKNLNMTQPGVSQHIKALESDLGVLLFLRKGKIIELTTAGERLRQFALNQGQAENQLRAAVCEDLPHAGEIKVSCSGSMAVLLYPQLLNLQAEYPDLQMKLEAAPNAKTIEQVKQNESDIGLITSATADPELTVNELGAERLCLVLPKGHSCQWSDLMKLGYIDHPNGVHYATQIFEQNYSKEFSGFRDVPVAGYVNQLGQILLPVAKGLGFTVLPESTIDLYPNQDLIEKAPLKADSRETIFMVTKKYKPLPRRYEQIIKILKCLWVHPSNDKK